MGADGPMRFWKDGTGVILRLDFAQAFSTPDQAMLKSVGTATAVARPSPSLLLRLGEMMKPAVPTPEGQPAPRQHVLSNIK
jgi:hypothetical protein